MFLTACFAFELGFVRVKMIKIDADVPVLATNYQSILDGSIILNMERQSKPRSTLSLVIYWTNHWSYPHLTSIILVVVIQQAALVGKVKICCTNTSVFHSLIKKGSQLRQLRQTR